ncbi:28S ribosomal protein S31, mitochondrial [Orussus abietinus]|uniref:28S ribosomal protein S31, mitochondrial n=1 Tax=Orussus abietinus TaxID=222816 RepID=UPI000626A54E|nr:28S ribosomal protein S31, mitochondrial [Orussus abietinus]
MIPIRLFLRSRTGVGGSIQWLYISTRRCNFSDSSSSSDSSDSDKDEKPSETNRKQKLDSAVSDVETRLNDLLNMMTKDMKVTKSLNVAISPRKKAIKRAEHSIDNPFEQKLKSAVESVATSLGGDQEKTKKELLSKLTDSDINKQRIPQGTKDSRDTPFSKGISKESAGLPPKKINIGEMNRAKLVKELLEEQRHRSNRYKEPIQTNDRTTLSSSRPSKIEDSVYESMDQKVGYPGRFQQITDKLRHVGSKYQGRIVIDHLYGLPLDIFTNDSVKNDKSPKLSTWEALQESELDLMVTHPPSNIFQEMILWTKQGKLWKFPIDNEQGMEEEHNIHFSEHVFMEYHLKDWCPKKGPIRHFMELVCVGLSKNPYMTVELKKSHIMWYRDYFAKKQDLLKEIGAIDAPILTSDTKQVTS